MPKETNLDKFLNSPAPSTGTVQPETKGQVFSQEWRMLDIDSIVREFQSGFACSKTNVVEKGLPHLRPNNIGYYGKLDLSHLIYLPSKLVNLQKYSLKPGDILFNNTNSKELVGRASLVTEFIEGGFSNHITRLRVNEDLVTPEWLAHCITYLWLRGSFIGECRKWIGQAGVNTTMLRAFRVPVPPLKEQKRIVDRIERITSKIKQTQMHRNEAYRTTKKIMQAAFHQQFSVSVQKGWQLKKLEDIGKITSGGTPSRQIKEYFLGDIPWFKARELNDTYLYASEEKITKGALQNSSAKLLPKDTIIIGLYDTAAGKLGMLTAQATTNQACAAIEPDSAVEPKYVLYALKYFRQKLIEKRRGIRQRNLNLSMIKNFEIPVPKLREQQEIISVLNTIENKVENIEKIQIETQNNIEMMNETVLRIALTGQL